MKAAFTPLYGPANVLEVREASTPSPGDHELLVELRAADVTAGDLRLRAADFPSFTAVIGRLMFGLWRPRHPVQGTMFAGRVCAVGAAVTAFAVGDRVFGSADRGTYAEYLCVADDASVAKMPEGMGYEEAASVSYGAGTAWHFLTELAQTQPGEQVLVLGASGGVGRYAVQIARHLGAQVTAVCSARNADLVRELGATHVIDYRAEDFRRSGRRYDVIFDIAGATSFRQSRASLTPRGRYLTVYLSVGVLVQMGWTALRGGQRALFSVAMGSQEQTRRLRELLVAGAIRPVVADRFPLARIADAHAAAERRQVQGSVVVTMGAAPTPS